MKEETIYLSVFDDGARGVGTVASMDVVAEIGAELCAVVGALFLIGVQRAASLARRSCDAGHARRRRAHAVHVPDGRFVHSSSHKVSITSNQVN